MNQIQLGPAELDKLRFQIVSGLEEPDPSKFHSLENMVPTTGHHLRPPHQTHPSVYVLALPSR